MYLTPEMEEMTVKVKCTVLEISNGGPDWVDEPGEGDE